VCTLRAQDLDAVKRNLVGTWRLVSYIREEIPSGAKSNIMGPHPSGFLNYSSDGRMIVLYVGSDRKRPIGAVANASEAETLYRDMLSYAGTYEVKRDVIIHHVRVSWNESWTGTDQTRNYKLEGDRLSLMTTPSPDPVEGKLSVRTLVWERVK